MADAQAKYPRWWPGFRRDIPLARGCVGHWPIWEGQAEKAYDVANPFDTGNHGTLTNGATWGAGVSGTTAVLDGDDDNVNLGANVITSAWDEITIVLNAYIPTSVATRGPFAAIGQYFTSGGWYLGRSSDSPATRVGFSIGTSPYAIFADAVVFDEWHQYTFAYSNSRSIAKFYRDADLVGDGLTGGSFADIPNVGNDLLIGQDEGDNNQAMNINAVSIYNRAFTASEVAEFTADPYALIRPPSTITTFAGVGAVGNNVPQKYMHYQRMRSA